MKATIVLILLIVMSCVTSRVLADTPSIGYEVAPCTSLDSAHHNATDHNLLLTWIRGFISGHDFTADRQRKSVRLVDEATIVRSVEKFCVAHPNQNMLHAAMNLIDELQKSDEALAKAMNDNPMDSAVYKKLPTACQKIIAAELECSRNSLEVDKLANPSFVTLDQSNIDAAKRQLYAAMPHIAETEGTSGLIRECKTSYLALVRGMEDVDVRNIVAHRGNPMVCKAAASAAINADP